MNKKKKYLIVSILLFIIAIIYTILVKNVDLAIIGPNNSEVGFSRLNGIVHNIFNQNMTWYEITKYLGILPFLLVLYYGVIGLKQLVKEKSFFKVDKKIIALGVFYICIGITYIFFEKCIINYRPVLIDGELEASFPSSHTLLAITICGSSLMISKYYINNEKIRKIVDILSIVIMLAIVIGRIISGVHWASDIIGGIIISSFLLCSLKTAISFIEE